MQEFPVAYRDQLAEEIPSIKKTFPVFNAYASADMQTLLGKFNRGNELQRNAVTLKSVWIENKGNFNFDIHVLPPVAQFSSVFGIATGDYNKDGNTDITLTGNMYDMHPYQGRTDASNAAVLLGNGKGTFKALSIFESGIYVPGNARTVIQFPYNGSLAMIAAQNKDKMLFFYLKK